MSGVISYFVAIQLARAIIAGGKGAAKDKIAALEAVGAAIAETPSDMGEAMQRAIASFGSRCSAN